MQIHELTLKKKVELDEGVLDTVKSGIAGAKQGYQTSKTNRAVGAMADKAYSVWKNYEAQLLQADPNARASGQLKQSLLAFVNKNLLGGMYLPNVINKDKITGLVDQIAGSGQATAPAPTTPTQPHTGGKVAGQLSQTPGAVAKRNTRAQAAQANTAGASAFGQMANQLTTKTPNTMANAPVSKVNVANPTAPTKTFGNVPSASTPAKPGQMPASVANSPQGKKMRQAYGKPRGGIQGMKSDLEEAMPTVKPITRPVGGLASRAKQRNAPTPAPANPAVAPAPTTPAAPAPQTPAPQTPAPTTPAAPAPQTPATPAPAAKAPAAPANEKELFKQLVQQASVAQTAAPGTSGGNAGQPNAKPGNVTAGGNEDARSMAQTLQQQLDPAIAKGLPALGATAAKLTGSKQVSSTGNPAADGLLLLMGFQGL
jgi:hypothetical protein